MSIRVGLYFFTAIWAVWIGNNAAMLVALIGTPVSGGIIQFGAPGPDTFLPILPVTGDIVGVVCVGTAILEILKNGSRSYTPSSAKPVADPPRAIVVALAPAIELPSAAVTLVQSINALLAAIPSPTRLDAGMLTEAQFTARAMTTDYLPATLAAYGAIPALNRSQSDDTLIAQLRDLERAAFVLVAGQTAHAVNILNANGSFIAERFPDVAPLPLRPQQT